MPGNQAKAAARGISRIRPIIAGNAICDLSEQSHEIKKREEKEKKILCNYKRDRLVVCEALNRQCGMMQPIEWKVSAPKLTHVTPSATLPY